MDKSVSVGPETNEQRQACHAMFAEATPLRQALPSERELSLSREFDAPRARVFDALTTPELLRRWCGVIGGWYWTECDIQPVAGTPYRFAWRDNRGADMGLRGTILEATRPERLVATERFDEAWYPGEATVGWMLSERDGRTTLTVTIRYETREARDGVLNSGMPQGMAASYDMLAELLAIMA